MTTPADPQTNERKFRFKDEWLVALVGTMPGVTPELIKRWRFQEKPYVAQALIDGDVLVCTPGGKQATLAALNKKTGDVIWESPVPGGDQSAYASAIVVEVGGVKHRLPGPLVGNQFLCCRDRR